jgi:hypothetical protein
MKVVLGILYIFFVSTVSAVLDTFPSGASIQIFSGLYQPNIQLNAEDYAGAWLVSRRRFMSTKQGIDAIGNLEAASFHIVRHHCQHCVTFMSRDYLDFMVDYLFILYMVELN